MIMCPMLESLGAETPWIGQKYVQTKVGLVSLEPTCKPDSKWLARLGSGFNVRFPFS